MIKPDTQGSALVDEDVEYAHVTVAKTRAPGAWYSRGIADGAVFDDEHEQVAEAFYAVLKQRVGQPAATETGARSTASVVVLQSSEDSNVARETDELPSEAELPVNAPRRGRAYQLTPGPQALVHVDQAKRPLLERAP